jgi:hypothetical protein
MSHMKGGYRGSTRESDMDRINNKYNLYAYPSKR